MSVDTTSSVPCVYAMGDGSGAIKFGVSEDPRSRLKTLQTGNASEMSLISVGDTAGLHDSPKSVAYGAEEVIHARLTDIGLHKRGEWFEPSIITTIVAELVSHDVEAACWFAVESSVYYGKARRGL